MIVECTSSKIRWTLERSYCIALELVTATLTSKSARIRTSLTPMEIPVYNPVGGPVVKVPRKIPSTLASGTIGEM